MCSIFLYFPFPLIFVCLGACHCGDVLAFWIHACYLKEISLGKAYAITLTWGNTLQSLLHFVNTPQGLVCTL